MTSKRKRDQGGSNFINRRILIRNCDYIKKNFLLNFTCGKIVVLLDITYNPILCLLTLWLYLQVKHKRKFFSILIPIYCRKSTIYYITFVFQKYRRPKIVALIGTPYAFSNHIHKKRSVRNCFEDNWNNKAGHAHNPFFGLFELFEHKIIFSTKNTKS